jgi:hypothetical protein
VFVIYHVAPPPELPPRDIDRVPDTEVGPNIEIAVLAWLMTPRGLAAIKMLLSF